MLRLTILLALIVPAVGLAPGAQAQADEHPEVDAAEAAFREGRPEEAAQRLDTYLRGHGDDAEAQYLYARILYTEGTSVHDPRRAAQALDRAVEIDPDNVVYLVAQLEGQRLERSNILLDLIRARRRYVIAQRILALDSTNAYAHEELGTWAIRDYYQYRNAISMPGVSFETTARGRNGPTTVDERASSGQVAGDDTGTLAVKSTVGMVGFLDYDGQDAAFGIDRFNIEQLRAQNVGIVTFETRANAAYETATAHLRTALRADPRRRSVYNHIVRLALISGRWDTAAPDLREMYVQFPTDPEMWLYTGLAAQRTGRYDDADAAFTEALRLMPEDERGVFTDLALILPPDEVSTYRADPDAFAQRYWTSRDPRFLNGVNERRTEHYARLVEADLLYRSDALGRPGWTTERGLLHVRYGPPDTDIIIDGSFAQALETFQADEIFGVRGSDGIIATPQNVGVSEAEQSANRFNVWTYADGLRLAFEDPNRNGQFRLYSPPAYAYALSSARNPARMDFVTIARQAVRETPERYTYVAPGRQVELPYRVTAFKGDGARTDLYVNYGIPLSEDAARTGDVDLTIQTGAFLVGAGRDLLAEHRRTIYGLRAAQIVPFAATRLWTATEPLEAPPGPNEVSVEFETAGGGASAVQRRAVDVPDFSRPGLLMSDVMLAYAIDPAGAAVPGRVQRGGVSILAAPWGVFAAGQPVYLYAEVYGLTPSGGRTDFEIEARLVPKDGSTGLRRLGRRLFGGRESGVASTAEAQGTATDDSADLRLSTEGQPPGLYTLTVTVRDRTTGATADRETDLLLEDPAAVLP